MVSEPRPPLLSWICLGPKEGFFLGGTGGGTLCLELSLMPIALSFPPQLRLGEELRLWGASKLVSRSLLPL